MKKYPSSRFIAEDAQARRCVWIVLPGIPDILDILWRRLSLGGVKQVHLWFCIIIGWCHMALVGYTTCWGCIVLFWNFPLRAPKLAVLAFVWCLCCISGPFLLASSSFVAWLVGWVRESFFAKSRLFFRPSVIQEPIEGSVCVSVGTGGRWWSLRF